ncbi:MAG: hypothetical protein RLZZ67_219 [Candidatus Parcubacteria bacterium]|jgi:hypothetical protein
MALTNNLRKQVDLPVWEWARFAPGVSSAVSSTTTSSNSTYHVSYGRYIYYLQAAATVAGGTSVGTGFWRYDTISDTYQQLAFPPVVPATFSGLQFVSGQGYYGRVLSAGTNTITCAALTGQILQSFDIRIIGGTGVGQHRVITGVTDPTIADNGTFTAVAATPQGNVTDANKNWVINQWVGYQVRFVANTGQTQVRKIIYNSSNVLYFADTNKYAEELNAFAPIVTITGAAVAIAAIGTQYQIESSVLTVDTPWTTIPDATSRFIVHSGAIWLLTAGTTSYLLEYYDVAADTWYVRNPGSNTSPVTANGTDGTIVNTGEVALVADRGTATGSQSSTTLQDTTKSWAVNSLSAAGYEVRIFSGTGLGQIRSIVSNTSNTLTVAAWTTTPDATSRYMIDGLEGGTASSAANSTQTASATGTISGNILTVGTTTGAYFGGQILTGTGVQDNTTVTSAQAACFTAGLTSSVIVAHGGTTGIVAGMYVTLLNGTGALTIGTKVSSTTSTTITLSNNVTTALGNATLQFSTAYVSSVLGSSSNGVVVTVASTTNLYPGMVVSVLAGTGAFAAGTYVTNVVNGTTFHVNTAPTTALASATVLGTPYQTIIAGQISGIPGGAGTYVVWPPQNVASTTITGTGVATLTDSTKTWPLHRWNGQSVRIISGTGMGQVRSIIGTKANNTAAYTSSAGATSSGTIITVASTTNLVVGMAVTVTAGVGSFAWNTTVMSITNATTFVVSAAPTVALSGGASVVIGSNNNSLFVYPAWSTVPDNTSVYVIHGDSDKLYFSLATQTPTFIHNVESDLVTQGRMLDYGVTRSAAAQFGDQIPVAISAGVPVQTVNYALGTSAAYLSAAGATSSGTLVTVTTTNGLQVGCPVTVSAGTGTFATGSYVAAINSATTFTVSATPSVALSGGASVVSGVASALAYFGMGPFVTTALSGSGATATATFVVAPGSTYSGTTTIPVNSLITVMGAIPATFNGTFVVTASSAGSVSWASAATGPQTTAGTLSSGNVLPVQAASATVAGCVPAGYNAASFTATAAAAGFVAYANATVGQLTATGIIQHLPQATSACTISATTATITFAGSAYFPIGSYVSVVGVTTVAAGSGSYNGVYQVTAAGAGTVSFTIASATPSGTASVQGTIQAATTTQLITTVNSHHFKAGQSISHTGDLHFASTNTNISAAITPLPGTLTQYTYTASGAAGTMIVFPQSTSILVDSTKNWVPNQWANCVVTFNSTQYAGALTGATVLSAYILTNTATKLIFAAAHSAAPSAGISRYVISLPPTSLNGSMLGNADNGLTLGTQSTTQIQDVTKYWAFPANVVQTAAGATSGASTITVVSAAGIYPGMMVAVTTNTAGSLTLPANTTVVSISGLVITLSNVLSGTTGSTNFTFFATCTSSGSTVTVVGYTTQGLQPGMYLGVNTIDNIRNSTTGQIQYQAAGAFVANGGTALTTTYVTAVTGTTTFTISTAPAIPLVNANVSASFWYTNQWVGRRVRLTTGSATNFLEQAVTASTTTGILTLGAFGSAPVSGVTGYAILQQPNRGLGTALVWNSGQTDQSKRALYLIQARGGGSTGFDRLNLSTDLWEFLTPTPNYEVLQTGAMYAYDGADRIYFTPQVTQRVYYLEIDTMRIHGGSQYPYAAGTVIIGNRMEIFITVDGLKYLWLNRHSGQECFKQLLFY